MKTHEGTKAVTKEVNEENEIQNHFRSFLNSISENASRKAEKYRIILRRKVDDDGLAFGKMREELQLARANKDRNFYTAGNFSTNRLKRSVSDSVMSVSSENFEKNVYNKKSYLEERSPRVKVEADKLSKMKKSYMLSCTVGQKNITRYFKTLIAEAEIKNLKKFEELKLKHKDLRFQEDVLKNRELLKFTDREFEAYEKMFYAEKLTQKQKSSFLIQWLATSDEYAQLTTGEAGERVRVLVESIRKIWAVLKSDTVELVSSCVLRYWARNCNALRVRLEDKDVEELFDAYHNLVNAGDVVVSKRCTFELLRILDEKKKKVF